MTRIFLSALLSLGLAIQSSGCSWTFTRRVPEDYHLSKPLECSAYGLPVADFMNAGYFAVMAFSPPQGMGDNVNQSLGWVVLGAYSTVGLLFLISGMTGIFWSENCHDTYIAHRHWIEQEKLRIVQERKEPPEKNLPPIPGIIPEHTADTKALVEKRNQPARPSRKKSTRRKRKTKRRVRHHSQHKKKSKRKKKKRGKKSKKHSRHR